MNKETPKELIERIGYNEFYRYYQEKNNYIYELELRFSKIKEYLKQIHIEQQNGILSSNNLIWDNIVRLCDGLEKLGDKENESS